jgi:uncharacterized protein YqiB (DUF1249 family)
MDFATWAKANGMYVDDKADAEAIWNAAASAERERWAKKCDEVAAILRRDPDEKKQISAHMADWLAVELRA